MGNLERFDKIPKGKFKGQVVDDLLNESSHNIMELLKEGYEFAPDVLARANITKTIRDVRVYNEVISRPKKNETLDKKDTKRQAEKVIEELITQEDDIEEE